MGEATRKTKKKATAPVETITMEMRLYEWIQNQTTFTMKDAVDFLRPFESENEPEERIERDINTMIHAEGLAFNSEADENSFTSAHAFFQGKSFVVSRFEFEQKNKVFIPGGRFAPFCHEAVLPSEMKLLTPEGNPLPIKKIKMTIEDAAAYYNLLGSEEMFHFFEAEHIDNVATLKVADIQGVLKLEVYDFSEFANTVSVKVTVQDWTNGVFTIEPTSETSLNTPPDWLKPFEKAIFKVFDRFSYYIEIPEQIRQALFLAPEIFTSKDLFETDRLLATSDTLEIILLGSRTILWRNDEDTPERKEQDPLPEGLSLTDSKVESLEDILAELKCPLTVVEIEAVIRDELFRGSTDFQSGYNRLFKAWDIQFDNDTQETYFNNYIEAMWEDIYDEYDRIDDQQNGRIRHFALAINKERWKWLARISRNAIPPSPRQEKLLSAIAERANVIIRLLETTNMRDEFADATEADTVIESLTALADQLDGLMQEYDADGDTPEDSEHHHHHHHANEHCGCDDEHCDCHGDHN